MKKYSLQGTWTMTGNGFSCTGTVPGSVYSFLLENGLMDDPFFRDNELKALELCDHDYTFQKTFNYSPCGSRVILRCEGLDTIAEIYMNGVRIAGTNNMHRTYEFDVTGVIIDGENTVSVVFHSADAYIKQEYKSKPVNGAWHCLKGFANIRKAYCMMGWDWGPRLPDAGIWRDISLIEKDSARITDLRITQRHADGRVFLTPIVSADAPAMAEITVTSPDGNVRTLTEGAENEIEEPQLWWPNGLGEQPLYTVTAILKENGRVADKQTRRIGLRDMRLIREKDKYGESFCHEVNGVRFFAMGADYIPEDNILSRVTEERTRKLLGQCRDAHFNAIRIWGGGYYPDDFFFDACDEYGIVVFFDLMFACTRLWVDGDFLGNVLHEVEDNMKRLRHHPSIALISGNNEIEEMWKSMSEKEQADYLRLFEDAIPSALSELCPEIPYVPSSPSSIGHFVDPGNENFGDCHYWTVWHGNKPFTEYRKHYFRYLSEFGFQSFPCEKTVDSFTLPEDRNIFSRIMEMHQRNNSANGKIVNYLSDTFRYPSEFGTLLYASQLLQATAMKYGVEHLRRNRGRCMGTLYWQLNDIWPVASWSSIDYYGRYKALQYYAARFYAPIMISCRETGERDTRSYLTFERTVDYRTAAELYVNNDTLKEVSGTVRWALRRNDGSVIREGSCNVTVPSLSVQKLDELDFNKTDTDNTYFSFLLEVNGTVVSEGTSLFTAPKYFGFKDPELTYEIIGDTITVRASAYAKDVEIYSPDSDFILSDNFFDMNAGEKAVRIISGTPGKILLRSVFDIK
ncbi:MAG: glycoside hydrolase family 2 protein [Clostridia bacterium]|nr:glycoside hydrolase family 2 protein [Clostridia bacterium]